MARSVGPRSRKGEIWEEKLRLEREAKDSKQRLLLAERERERLQVENEKLRERAAYIESLRQEVQAQGEKLLLLARLTSEISSFDLDRTFDVCVTRVPFIFNARHISIYLYDEERKKLTLKRHSHERQIDHVVDVERSPASLMARALTASRIDVIEDVAALEAEAQQRVERRFAGHYLTRSCIIAPLRMGNRTLGILNLADRLDGQPFRPERDLPLIRQIAELLAISLDNYRLFEEAERQAKIDPVTRLANHRTFHDDLSREVSRVHRYGGEVALLLLDIDSFRALNENLGHAAGDAVLREVGRLLRESLRTVDVAARYGADEFAAVLPEQDLEGAAVVARRIAERIRETSIALGDRKVAVRLSMGLAQLRAKESPTELVRRAEEALEEARREGGGRVAIRK